MCRTKSCLRAFSERTYCNGQVSGKTIIALTLQAAHAEAQGAARAFRQLVSGLLRYQGCRQWVLVALDCQCVACMSQASCI